MANQPVPFTSNNISAKPEQSIISILLVDDSPMFLRFIGDFLERRTELRVVGAVLSAEQAYELARRFHPEVIVIDLDMQIFSNALAISFLRTRSPASEIIALTLTEDFESSAILQKFGVDVVISKTRLHSDLTSAIFERTSWHQELDAGLIRQQSFTF